MLLPQYHLGTRRHIIPDVTMVEQTCSSFTIKNDYGSEVSSQIDAWPQENQQNIITPSGTCFELE